MKSTLEISPLAQALATLRRLRTYALLLMLPMLLMVTQAARAQSTYYVDYSTGSNSNSGTSEASPWKSAPGMQTGAGCAGATHAYTHATGDHFIFKGGVTWPAACFSMDINFGGTSSTQDYWGVDVTWFSGGSFTRPTFDLAQTDPLADATYGRHSVIEVTQSYVTIDNIEIANQGIDGSQFGATAGIGAFGGSGNLVGIIVEHSYLHDWVTTQTFGSATDGGGPAYESGGIFGFVTADGDTVSDAGGYAFNASGTKVSVEFGGGCVNCAEVKNSTWHDTMDACFTVSSCHDNEFYGISQTIWDSSFTWSTSNPNCGASTCRPHTQIVEEDCPNLCIQGGAAYNNFFHDNSAGEIIGVDYSWSVYNNSFWNNSGQTAILIDDRNTTSGNAGKTGYIANNTCSNTGSGCIRYLGTVPSPGGTLNIQNNVLLPNGVQAIESFSGSGLTVNQSTNFGTGASGDNNMTSTEATTYGFTQTNKGNPSSSDPNVSGEGVNLTSLCGGNLTALCLDASGAPWFGGAPKTRPTGSTGWDLGAFQGQGGGSSPGPPTVTITSPSAGTVSGTQTLTATATPQGTATISSCQFTIDGFTFGPALTSGPYTLSWNTNTAANASHVIGASCTDSNAQVGTASSVTVTVSNSHPGCFVSADNDTGTLSWSAHQAFTAQTTNFTATFTATPNTANQDSVIGLSQSPATAYSQMAALVRFNSSRQIDVYKGSLGDYTADATVSYSAGTTYAFTFAINMTAGTYTVALTSPSSVTLATGYTFRTTAPVTSLGYLNAVSDDTTPDTSQVCAFALAGSTSLTFSPSSLGFGSVTVGANSTQTITTTTTGGSVNFTSAAISGNADFTINSNTCTGSIPSSCTTQIKFAPTSAALETATVTFTDDATGSPQSVAVSGTGVPATPTLSVNPASLSFGGVLIHTTSSSGPIVLTIASGPVTFTGTPSLSGANAADLALASNTCTGSVSASSCQTVVSFTPSLVGAESATVTYTDNATGSPQSVPLSGTGYLAPHPPTAVHATVN